MNRAGLVGAGRDCRARSAAAPEQEPRAPAARPGAAREGDGIRDTMDARGSLTTAAWARSGRRARPRSIGRAWAVGLACLCILAADGARPAPDATEDSAAETPASAGEAPVAAVEDRAGDGAGDPFDDAPSGPIVERLRWDGVEVFEESEVEARIVTTERAAFELRFWRPAPRLDSFTLEDDLDRVRDLYRSIGYFETQVEATVVPLGGNAGAATEPERVEIHFDVREGLPMRLASWQLEIVDESGTAFPLSAAERSQLQALVEFETGRRFGTRLYREAREALLEASAEMGFLFAQIEGGADVDVETHEARVDWRLRTGPRAVVGEVVLTGLDEVAEHVVRRNLRLEAGQVLRASALGDSERRLIETGLFRSVVVGRPQRPDDRPAGDGVVDLEIFLDEAPMRSVRASVGYGTEDGPRAEASLDWRNFLGDARRLGLRAFGSFLDIGFEGTLGQPHLFDPLSRGDLAVSALRQSRPGYEAFVTGATGFATRQTQRDGSLRVLFGMGYELSEILSFEIAADPALRGPTDSVIVNLYGGLRFDRVDDRLDPRRGVRASLEAELGGYPIGSDLDYHRWELDLRGYHSIGIVTLAARAAATTLDPIDGSRADVPLTRRLYSGGTQSIRGFGFQKLGPEDGSNDPIGGLSRLELSSELRFRVYGPLALVAFVDAGDVRSRPFVFRPTELRASAGPGLRYDTPVGPLRLDAGFLLNPPPDTDPWRIHLSVGHAF